MEKRNWLWSEILLTVFGWNFWCLNWWLCCVKQTQGYSKTALHSFDYSAHFLFSEASECHLGLGIVGMQVNWGNQLIHFTLHRISRVRGGLPLNLWNWIGINKVYLRVTSLFVLFLHFPLVRCAVNYENPCCLFFCDIIPFYSIEIIRLWF